MGQTKRALVTGVGSSDLLGNADERKHERSSCAALPERMLKPNETLRLEDLRTLPISGDNVNRSRRRSPAELTTKRDLNPAHRGPTTEREI
jgi:hypothetical protein